MTKEVNRLLKKEAWVEEISPLLWISSTCSLVVEEEHREKGEVNF